MTSENKVCWLLRSDKCLSKKDMERKQLVVTLPQKSAVAALLNRQWPLHIQLQENQPLRLKKQCSIDHAEEEKHNGLQEKEENARKGP